MNILCSFSFGVFAFHPIPLFIKQILIEYLLYAGARHYSLGTVLTKSL